jgi:hypothetical protein
MCFGSMPKPDKPPAPPTERDATVDATRNRATAAGKGGVSDTLLTGPGGIAETGGTRPTLGG